MTPRDQADLDREAEVAYDNSMKNWGVNKTVTQRTIYYEGFASGVQHERQKAESLAKDHADDWRRIQDAERALEAEKARHAELVEAVEAASEAEYWMQHAKYQVTSAELEACEGWTDLRKALAKFKGDRP